MGLDLNECVTAGVKSRYVGRRSTVSRTTSLLKTIVPTNFIWMRRAGCTAAVPKALLPVWASV